MAGVDYMEWGMYIEEWERDDELPPPHLLAHADGEEEEEEFMRRRFHRKNNNKNVEDDGGDHEVGYRGMVQWRRRMENVWLCFLTMVQVMMKLAALLLNTFEINNMSIEALAMAGLDYQVCGIEFHVWEDQPPPYLLADSNSGHEVEKTMSSSRSRGSNKFSVNQVLAKVEMVELVQIIATMNQMALRNY
ncbi:hypothetical protein GQ457_05G014620 [Hibiscus cannabinus]